MLPERNWFIRKEITKTIFILVFEAAAPFYRLFVKALFGNYGRIDNLVPSYGKSSVESVPFALKMWIYLGSIFITNLSYFIVGEIDSGDVKLS